MSFNEIHDLLKKSFRKSFSMERRRNRLYQIFIPIFHDDGDMMDIFVQEMDDGLRVCDSGMTVMRLSYTFDISTDRRKKILADILSEAGAFMDEGNIYIPSSPELLFENVMQLSQTISKISALRYTSQKHVASLFYEDVENYILSSLKGFFPQKNYVPIKEHDEFSVDYFFPIKNKPPVFLFAIRGNEKALSSALAVLAFQKGNMNFTSIAVHDNFSRLKTSTQKKITNVMDKQFFDYSSFEDASPEYFSRLAG